MLRFTLAALAASGFAAAASAGTAFTAELVAPTQERAEVVANKAVWTCVDGACTAELARKAPTVRECKRFVKKAGAVATFESVNGALDEAELEACNASARG